MANRLAHESSPYLKQHANNPVDWFPWGSEALAKAMELDRPIFLSVGYSACHWCHVMEHESFEDESVARFLNEHFISIKVDREERPDVDQIYMTAVQMLTGQGGWPMSVFLTPDLKPFYGGTYFPPQPNYGRPSFMQVLEGVLRAWDEKRCDLGQQAEQITEAIRQQTKLEPGDQEPTVDLLHGAEHHLSRSFDRIHGGFGSAPKFPHAMEIRLLLRIAKRFQDGAARDMAVKTLDHMARGGMYDHLGGGFHRYSTDARWLVPHFEKMLYDNALLTSAYLDGYQATGDIFFREVAEDILGYVEREMTSPDGAFYSAQDADSEGVEGKFFVWSVAEIEALGAEAELFCDVYDVTPEGNWEGHNILNRPKTYTQSAKLLRLDEEEMKARLRGSRARLYEVRSRRVWPGLDDKILTSWNALMIGAFAHAACVLDRPAYAQVAAKAASFLLDRMRAPAGLLHRTCSKDSAAKLNGYLDDYSYFIDALVSLYEATFDPQWIDSALSLSDVMIEQFWDEAEGGFFYTGKDHEQLITRTKDPHDGSIPSGNSMAVTGLLRLARLTGRQDLDDKADRTLKLFQGLMASYPTATGQMLNALDFRLGPTIEVAVVGDPKSKEVREALRIIRSAYVPNKVVAARSESHAQVPLLEGKTASGAVTTYVCQNFACQAPIVGVEAISQAVKAW